MDCGECENIFDAIDCKHIECIKKFPDQVNKNMGKKHNCNTPLEKEILKSYPSSKVIEVLLDMGAMVTDTVLFTSSTFCKPSIVKLLLSYGADPNKQRNGSANTCLVSAIDDYFCTVDTLDDIANNRLSVIKLLVTYGADFSYINYEFLNEKFDEPDERHIHTVLNAIREVGKSTL